VAVTKDALCISCFPADGARATITRLRRVKVSGKLVIFARRAVAVIVVLHVSDAAAAAFLEAHVDHWLVAAAQEHAGLEASPLRSLHILFAQDP